MSTKIKKYGCKDADIEWVHTAKNLTITEMHATLAQEMYEVTEKALKWGAELEVNANSDGTSPVAYFTLSLPGGEPYTEKHIFI